MTPLRRSAVMTRLRRAAIDIRPHLAQVAVPTLVAHARDEVVIPFSRAASPPPEFGRPAAFPGRPQPSAALTSRHGRCSCARCTPSSVRPRPGSPPIQVSSASAQRGRMAAGEPVRGGQDGAVPVVSKRSDVVVAPRRTLTSVANPCSATRPTNVRPVSNCGATAVPMVNGVTGCTRRRPAACRTACRPAR